MKFRVFIGEADMHTPPRVQFRIGKRAAIAGLINLKISCKPTGKGVRRTLRKYGIPGFGLRKEWQAASLDGRVIACESQRANERQSLWVLVTPWFWVFFTVYWYSPERVRYWADWAKAQGL
jgi:hypothetical protein